MAFDTRLLSGIDVLVAVAETGSFTRAGEALGLTGSGISRAVSRLETRVGTRLFERSPRAVRLTPEGQAFYRRIAPLLEEVQIATAEAKGERGVIAGHLRIAADAPGARLVLARMLPGFLARHPRVSAEVVVREQRTDLVSGGFDAAVYFDEADTAAGDGLTSLGLTSVVTVAAPAYLAGRPMPDDPSALASLSCIVLRDPMSQAPYPWTFQNEGRAIELRPRPSIIANDGTTMLAACLAGGGVAQLLAIEVEDALAAGTLALMFQDWQEIPYACWLQATTGRFQSARLATFVRELEAFCADAL